VHGTFFREIETAPSHIVVFLWKLFRKFDVCVGLLLTEFKFSLIHEGLKLAVIEDSFNETLFLNSIFLFVQLIILKNEMNLALFRNILPFKGLTDIKKSSTFDDLGAFTLSLIIFTIRKVFLKEFSNCLVRIDSDSRSFEI
jgi:hypothetical protein